MYLCFWLRACASRIKRASRRIPRDAAFAVLCSLSRDVTLTSVVHRSIAVIWRVFCGWARTRGQRSFVRLRSVCATRELFRCGFLDFARNQDKKETKQKKTKTKTVQSVRSGIKVVSSAVNRGKYRLHVVTFFPPDFHERMSSVVGIVAVLL